MSQEMVTRNIDSKCFRILLQTLQIFIRGGGRKKDWEFLWIRRKNNWNQSLLYNQLEENTRDEMT